VGVVRLDRPPANALDLQMGLELQAAIGEAGDRDDVGVLVLWGGRKLFAAGADIKAMAMWSSDEVKPSADALGAACDLLEDLPKISIAAVNGYALGGGLELALGADLRYLADDAVVGQPEIKLGVIPGAGGTQRLTRAVGKARAMELILTGQSIDAREAERLGMVSLVVPAEETVERALELAGRVAAMPPLAVRAAKAAVNAAAELPLSEGLAREQGLFFGLFASDDQKEGMAAFAQKRPARWTGR
jgi:enoyl-CoA hydratase/carnithine racemase